jgi:hypothetical protein
MKQPHQEPPTLAGIGRAIGLLAHDLSNTITVLMGVTEELRSDSPRGDLETAQTTEATAAKLDRLGKALFALRQEALRRQATDGEACADRLVDWLPEMKEVATAFHGMPPIQASQAQVEGLWAILGAMARHQGGFEDIAPAEIPANLTPRLHITFIVRVHDEPASASLLPLVEAVEAMGGTLGTDGNRISLRLPAVRSTASGLG